MTGGPPGAADVGVVVEVFVDVPGVPPGLWRPRARDCPGAGAAPPWFGGGAVEGRGVVGA
jgi:hypothetical protein